MNFHKDDFGHLLPLDYGENVIVLVADDGAGNVSSKLLRVERSDRFTAQIDSPEFGKFANGETQTVAGAVSRELRVDEADGGASQLTLASLTVAGVPVTLGGGASQSYSVPMAPPGCTNSIMPIIVSACWTGSTFSASYTNICADVPLGLLEGYEIVRRHWQWDGRAPFVPPSFARDEQACGSATPWRNDTARYVTAEWYDVCAGGDNEGFTNFWAEAVETCVAVPDTLTVSWQALEPQWGGSWSTLHPGERYPFRLQRGLVVGHARMRWENASYLAVGDEVIDATGSLTFRRPLSYGTNQVVIFTLEGVTTEPAFYGMDPVVDLSGLKLVLGGVTNTPSGVATNNGRVDVSYVVPIGLQTEWTLDENSFVCSGGATNWADEYGTGTITNHMLRFTGFHNSKPFEAKIVAKQYIATAGGFVQPVILGYATPVEFTLVTEPPVDLAATYKPHTL